ncbi:MAG: cytidine deaminase [Mariniblastus sp.]|nr:cytidine deaminase [Mariniblastus sp.]
MMTPNDQALLEAARAARENAYAVYSHFQVGAALRTRDGTIITGCNVENGSYGLSICAERTAIVRAVAMGYTEFDTIAVVAHPLATPCGACREFIIEFGQEIRVLCADANDLSRVQSWQIAELLPDSFDRASLPRSGQ